ncbi:MAG: 23S rRNA (uracil(1939)-C(5))-methyltransferase RlmD [Chitinophagales bacterium]|jgi:23S rRNA (uracil1939-C5)-methyltransferase|nr:23S rRNA (uracil(1939)-C(5))-methyltransferase RlmD [Chitinophagales bacterium]
MKSQEIHTLKIENHTSKFQAFGYIDGHKVLINDDIAPPLIGEEVKVKLKRRQKGVWNAQMLEILTQSLHRIQPLCNHFGICGGCKWQHIDYAIQVQMKQAYMQKLVEHHFPKLDVYPMIQAEITLGYRNKLDYGFSNKKWLTQSQIMDNQEIIDRDALGFHKSGMFDKIIDIESCLHIDAPNDEIRNFVRQKSKELNIPYYDLRAHEGNLRTMMIRKSSLGEILLLVVAHHIDEGIEALLAAIHTKFPQITSLLYAENQKLNDSIYDLSIKIYSGRDYILEELGDLKFKIHAKSFFQTNTTQCKVLYDKIAEIAQIQPQDIVYDLFCGVGSISLYIAKYAKKVIGIELIADAIADANENKALNQIDNLSFHCGDVYHLLDENFLNHEGLPDIIISDPPRVGMGAKICKTLLEAKIPKIVYVSCNPKTLMSDLEILSERYDIHFIQPVDMFPQTTHIENITLLTLKSSL